MSPNIEFILIPDGGLYFLWCSTYQGYLLNDKTIWHTSTLLLESGVSLSAAYQNPVNAFAFLERSFTFFIVHMGGATVKPPEIVSAYMAQPSVN